MCFFQPAETNQGRTIVFAQQNTICFEPFSKFLIGREHVAHGTKKFCFMNSSLGPLI